MDDEPDSETTLSLSLVDGLSCALAAVILLFLIFSVTVMSARVSAERGPAHSGDVRGLLSGSEPTDIEVQFKNPLPASARPIWVSPDDINDRIILGASDIGGGAKSILGVTRRLSARKPNWRWLPAAQVGLDVALSGPSDSESRPQGTIAIYRSTETTVFVFECREGLSAYRIISRISTTTLSPAGDCPIKKVK